MSGQKQIGKQVCQAALALLDFTGECKSAKMTNEKHTRACQGSLHHTDRVGFRVQEIMWYLVVRKTNHR